MIDLHCHILPGIDDGAPDVSVSLAMARAYVADGVSTVACTPHIMPGLYDNAGPQILQAVAELQVELDRESIPLRLVAGADIHIVPGLAAGVQSGRLPALGGSRYILIELPHHVAPLRTENLFFDLLVAGYVPILTHPERLSWIGSHYAMIERMVCSGALMQITAGSLAGAFGQSARYWAERMLDEERVHVIASDAHDVTRRPPDLARGRDLAARRVGPGEALHLVLTRPHGILANHHPSDLPMPPPADRVQRNVR